MGVTLVGAPFSFIPLPFLAYKPQCPIYVFRGKGESRARGYSTDDCAPIRLGRTDMGFREGSGWLVLNLGEPSVSWPLGRGRGPFQSGDDSRRVGTV